MKKILFSLLVFKCLSVSAGTITASLTSIPGFGNVYVFHSSVSQRYTVSGSGLTAPLVITAPAGFEVSLTYQHSYTHSIQLNPVSGTVAATSIYVRFSPSATGAASGHVLNSSSGSTTQQIAVSGTGINWAIPTNYYNSITTQRNAALKTALYSIISSGTTTLSYTPGVWNAFYTTDVQPNGKVWDVYSTRFDQASPYEFTLGTNQCGSYTAEGQCYNREHSFPQSWFGGSVSPMHTDVHHVFATDGKVNAERGNFPFGNVTSVSYTSMYGGKRGTATTNFGYTGTVFEPIDEYKGDIARAQLYMATRYENLIAGWQSNSNANDVLAGNAWPAYDPWHVSLLISWHNLDPVSDKEIKRNNAIYALQNNRNPFVDSPQFVQRIWGGSIPAEPTVQATNLQVVNNSTTSVTLRWVSGNGQRRIVLVRQGATLTQLPVDTVHYAANANLSLAPHIGSGSYVVYNGTGSSVTITGMLPNVLYHYAVIEYNGWYTSANYNTTAFLTSSSTTLPVSWLGVSAIRTHLGVAIKWATASEHNNDYFEVQRSENGVDFEHIHQAKGAGNSNTVMHYNYLDEGADMREAYYYRIRQVDADGSDAFSETVYVPAGINHTLRVFPNPATTYIQISGISQYNTYSIQNQHGQVVVKGVVAYEQNLLDIAVGSLPVGLYFITISDEAGRAISRTRFIKQ